MGRDKETIATPSRPPTGSTRPVRVAYPRALPRLYPSRSKGNATAEPSGIFWRPIAVAIIRPLAMSPPPKLTPTAIPSGKLWIVMAMMNSHRRANLDEGPSGPETKWAWGVKRSMRWRVKAPIARPTTATHTLPSSMAGTMRLKEEAASITPAAKPSITSRRRSEIRLKNRTGTAPAPVARPAARLAVNPSLITSTSKSCHPFEHPIHKREENARLARDL